MAPKKGPNAKQEAGRAKKAANEEVKKQKAVDAAEAKEAVEWSVGAKGKNAKKAAEEEKKAADAARKAERDRLLAEEEASLPSKPKAGGKKAAPRPAGPGALAAGGGISGSSTPGEHDQPEEYTATGLDDALDLLSIVNSKSDKASVGAQAGQLEQHPERRFKAAFEAYKERMLPKMKMDFPGLRMNQYEEKMYKRFQKAPENPFNQVSVAYNASKEDKVAALNSQKQATADRLRRK